MPKELSDMMNDDMEPKDGEGDEPEPTDNKDARHAACKAVMDAVRMGNAEGLDSALSSWMSLYEPEKDEESDSMPEEKGHSKGLAILLAPKSKE